MIGIIKRVTLTFVIIISAFVIYSAGAEYINQLTTVNIMHSTADMTFQYLVSENDIEIERSDWYTKYRTDYDSLKSFIRSNGNDWNGVFTDLESRHTVMNTKNYGLTFMPETFLKNNYLDSLKVAMQYSFSDTNYVKVGHYNPTDIAWARSRGVNIPLSTVVSNRHFEVDSRSAKLKISATPKYYSDTSDFYRAYVSSVDTPSGSIPNVDTSYGYTPPRSIIAYNIEFSFEYCIPYSNGLIKILTGQYGTVNKYTYKNVYYLAR